jgi:Rieske Fe-S protein
MPDHEQNDLNRRDFIKITTGLVVGFIGAAVGLPTIAYVLDPAFKSGGKQAWIPVGKIAEMVIGKPYPFSFTRVQVNGWERTSTTHGGFAVRNSADPKDIIVLNSRCTHLGCTVNWKNEAQAFVCPCLDAKFSKEGVVLGGPPPRPLDRYGQFRVTDAGVLEIFYKES